MSLNIWDSFFPLLNSNTTGKGKSPCAFCCNLLIFPFPTFFTAPLYSFSPTSHPNPLHAHIIIIIIIIIIIYTEHCLWIIFSCLGVPGGLHPQEVHHLGHWALTVLQVRPLYSKPGAYYICDIMVVLWGRKCKLRYREKRWKGKRRKLRQKRGKTLLKWIFLVIN